MSSQTGKGCRQTKNIAAGPNFRLIGALKDIAIFNVIARDFIVNQGAPDLVIKQPSALVFRVRWCNDTSHLTGVGIFPPQRKSFILRIVNAFALRRWVDVKTFGRLLPWHSFRNAAWCK